MPNPENALPEGTDAVIPGAAAADSGSPGGFEEARFGVPAEETSNRADKKAVTGKLSDAAAKVGEATSGLRAQATDKAYGIAAQGKERAVGLLDNVTQLVDDAASQIDEKVGEQYGAYARQASQTVAGFADSLRDRDIDDLLGDAREFVRKSPAIAIGAAAAAGFLFARILKVGLSDATPRAPADDFGLARPAPSPAAETPSYGATTRKTPDTAVTMPVDPGY